MSTSDIRHYCPYCGAPLARDRATDERCRACQEKFAALLVEPPQVPADFWEIDQLRDAFAAQHIGQVSRAYRTHPYHVAMYGRDGITQEILGGWLGLSQPQVSRIETGPPVRNLDTLCYWARTLRIPPHLLWFRLPDDQRPLTLKPADTASGASTPKPSGAAREHGSPVPLLTWIRINEQAVLIDGRALLRDGVPIISGRQAVLPVLELDDLKRIVAAVDDAPRYLDSTAVGHLRRQIAECAADDGADGPKGTLPTVLGIIGTVERNARQVKPSVRQALLAVGAQGAEFAGWLYRDLGMPGIANYWRDRAMEWAQEAGESAMQGYVLLKKSQACWDERDGLRMLTLAQAVQDGPWQLPRRVRAEAAQQEARGHATLDNNFDLVERKLYEAGELLAEDEPHNEETAGAQLGTHYDAPLLGVQTAICYCEANQPQRSVELYQKWLSEKVFSRRDYGYFLSLMGGTLTVAGEPDEASKVGLQAVCIAGATDSTRTLRELVRLVDRLARWSDRSSVRQFRDALRDALLV